MHVFDEKDNYPSVKKTFTMNGFENIVENGAFAHNEQMLHFLHVFYSHRLQRLYKAYIWSKGLSLFDIIVL